MKRLIFYPLLFILILSCSSLVNIIPHHKKTDPALKPYIKAMPFESNTVAGFKVADALFEKVNDYIRNGTVVGFCGISLFPPTTQVSINPHYWRRATYKQKMALIIHEFMHCDYAQQHDDTMMENSFCPASLMHSSTLPEYCLNTYWDYYILDILEKIK